MTSRRVEAVAYAYAYKYACARGTRAVLFATGISVLAITLASRPANAQQHDSAGVLTTSSPSDPAVPEVFDSLTVRGRRDWSAYVTPDLCVQAAAAVDNLARRLVVSWTDTVPYAPERATLADSAVRIARDCGGRFHAATSPPRDLLDVAHLALMRGDDAEAQAAAARYVESFPQGNARYWALVDVDSMYRLARPARLAAADSVARVLDGYGLAATEQRAEVHENLLHDAERRYDIPRIEQEVVAILKSHEEQKIPLDGGYVLRLYGAELYHSMTEAPERTISVLKSAGITIPHADSLLLMLRLGGEFIRQPVPPLTADFWVGVDSAAQTWPVRGKASILLTGGQQHEYPARVAMWGRIARKYGSALNITFMYRTEGSFHNGPPLTAAQEAERIGRYYRDDLKMPVTVAVRETKFKVLPDGRRVPLPLEKEVDRAGPLIDASGKVIMKGFDGGPAGYGEPGVMMWIDRALGRDHDTAPLTGQSK